MSQSLSSPRCRQIRFGQRGSALVPFLLFSLVLAVSISLYLGRWSQLFDSKNLRSLCRSKLAEGQKTSGENIQNLLSLNPLVKAAKIEMIAAKAALATAVAAMNAPAIKAAELWIKKVKAQQNALRLQQKLFLFRIGWATKTAAVEASQTLMREKAKGLHEREIQNLQIKPAQNSVRPLSKSDSYPEYELEENFEHLQKVELRWHSHFVVGRSEQKWKGQAINLPESCGMTLRPEGLGSQNRFTLLPVQDKYFWKR